MYIRPTFLPEVAKLPEATLPWDLPSGARPKAPAVIVPVFGPIRLLRCSRTHKGCVRCPADGEVGLFVWTNKGEGRPHGVTADKSVGVYSALTNEDVNGLKTLMQKPTYECLSYPL